MDINNQFKALRRRAHKTQNEMSKLFEKSGNGYTYCETKQKRLTPHNEKILKKFNVNINWMKTGKGEMFVGPSILNGKSQMAREEPIDNYDHSSDQMNDRITNLRNKIANHEETILTQNKTINYLHDEIKRLKG